MKHEAVSFLTNFVTDTRQREGLKMLHNARKTVQNRRSSALVSLKTMPTHKLQLSLLETPLLLSNTQPFP